jgi:hypothetical protein
MTEKQKYALNKTISALPEEFQKAYREVAEYAISLGYMPVLKGANETYTDFIKSKTKRTILKIEFNANPPNLGIKFYAIPEYHGIFHKAIEESLKYHAKLNYEIKEHCTGCMQRRNGRCNEPQGYTFKFPDEKQGFICGFGIVRLPSFSDENVEEVKEALKLQDEHFMKQISV